MQTKAWRGATFSHCYTQDLVSERSLKGRNAQLDNTALHASAAL